MKTLTAAELKEGSIPSGKFGPMKDEVYFLFAENYLLNDFLPFWQRYKAAAGLAYRKGRTDCDDFAIAFMGQMAAAAVGLDTTAAPAVGIVQVINTRETLGIAAGSHVLNLAAVDRGGKPQWLFIDPITNQHAYHEDYPASIRLVSV